MLPNNLFGFEHAVGSARPPRNRRLALELLDSRSLMAFDLDPLYGLGGWKSVDSSTTQTSDFSIDSALQADQKVVTVGSTGGKFKIDRWQSTGFLDNSFGSLGTLTVPFSSAINGQPILLSSAANAAVIQSDSKIVVAGSAGDFFGIARLNTNGSLDSSFSFDGKAEVPFSLSAAKATGVAMFGQKIVLAGTASQSPASGTGGGNRDRIALARLDSNGNLDTSFGQTGTALLNVTSDSQDQVSGIAVQSDGKILLAGTSRRPTSVDAFLIRLNASGFLDTSFANGGLRVFEFSSGALDEGGAITIQPDGKILVAGTRTTTNGSSDFAVARFNLSGTLDSSFGTLGVRLIDFGGSEEYCNDIKVQSDGRIVLTGQIGISGSRLGLVRLDSNGSIDPDLGKLVSSFSTKAHVATSLEVLPDGSFVVSGSINQSTTNTDSFVAKYSRRNEAPTDILLSSARIAENSGVDAAIGTLSTIDSDPANTFTYTLVGGVGAADNAAFLISGDKLKAAINFDFETKNSYSIRVRSTDQGGLFTEKVFNIDVLDVNEPVVGSVFINDSSVSRSQITSLQVEFSSELNLALLASAFVITNIDNNTTVGEIIVSGSYVAGKTIATLTFGGTSTVARQGTANLGNSLANGNYRLDIRASQIRIAGTNTPMAADYVFGGQTINAQNNDNFFRLLGDTNGDGVLNGIDLNAIIPSLFNPLGYRADLDTNGDGVINGIDLNALIPTLFGPGRH